MANKIKYPKKYKIHNNTRIKELVQLYNNYVEVWNYNEANGSNCDPILPYPLHTVWGDCGTIIFYLPDEVFTVPELKPSVSEMRWRALENNPHEHWAFTPHYVLDIGPGFSVFKSRSSYMKRHITPNEVLDAHVEFLGGSGMKRMGVAE